MTKILNLLFLSSIILLFGCHEDLSKKNAKLSPSFKSFEMSYTNGWLGSFSFFIDTNKVFFAPKYQDSVFYGVVPDSIFAIVDLSFQHIKKDRKNLKDIIENCSDCDDIAVETIIGSDTLRFRQRGKINNVFARLIKPLRNYIDSNKQSSLHAYMFFNTYNRLHPPTKFLDVFSKIDK
jgi:hypothetical protein